MDPLDARNEPRTEAGRALLDDARRVDAFGGMTDDIYCSVDFLTERILAIEAEAAQGIVGPPREDAACDDCERTHPWRDHSDPAIEGRASEAGSSNPDRLTLDSIIDNIAQSLSREFVQGNPADLFTRADIAKRLTAVMDSHRYAALDQRQQADQPPSKGSVKP